MFTLQRQDGNKCNIGGYAPKGGAITVGIKPYQVNSYINQGFELDNNFKNYRKYFSFIDCKLFK